jgi:diguanylate cyclase (GGDEF)-like protein
LLLLLGLLAPAAAAAEFELARWRGDAPREEVVRGVHDAQFEPLPVGTRHLAPAARSNTWWRLRLEASWHGAEPPVLALYAPYGNRITVYVPPDYVGRERTLRDPDFDPRHTRHALSYRLPAELGPGTPIYVELAGGRRAAVRAAIEDLAVFEAGEVVYQRRISAILTVIAVMFVVVGAFALALREVLFALLAGALGAQWIYALLITGEAYALPLLRELAGAGVIAVWVFRALGSGLLLLFTVRFLDLALHAPRLKRVLSVAAWSFLVLAVLAVAVPLSVSQRTLPLLGNVLLFGSAALALLGAAIAWHHGSRAARFFLLAWLPVLSLDVLRQAQLLGVAPPHWGNEYLLPAALAFAALMFSSGLAERMLTVRHERDAARREAERDPLTGVLNRAAISARLRAACDEAWLTRNPVSILFLDLDRFKEINDGLGHALGDACLAALVARIAKELRQGDSLGRYGGEEFLVVLPGASAADAAAIAERIRADVALGCRSVAGEAVGLTISIGVAQFGGGTQPPDALVAAADAAMYEAKRLGRNRVIVAAG